MIPIGVSVSAYLSDLAVDNKRPRYIDFQKTRLRYFVTHITAIHPDYHIQDLCVEDARGFLATLQKKEVRFANHPRKHEVAGKLSSGYIHGIGRALKAFSSWAFQYRYLDINVLAGMDLPKIPKRQPIPLTEQEMKKVIEGALNSTLEWERNVALISLMMDTGMRVEEISNLKESQINFTTGQIIDLGKGDKMRVVPFAREARLALLHYKSIRPPAIDPDKDFFFLTSDGYHLEINPIEKMFQRLRVIVNIPRLTPHLLRHTFAVRSLLLGADLASISRILGHESIATTQKYLNMCSEDIKEQHRHFSPMDNLNMGRRRGRRPSNQLGRS